MKSLMLYGLLLMLICTLQRAGAQQVSIGVVIVDSGKAEFKRQALLDTPNYTVARRMLQTQVALNPARAELHYFLGYAIDRMQTYDAKYMMQIDVHSTREASVEMETVIRLEPEYKGELVMLDPYGKLTAIWGSLAGSYLGRGNEDSARWALREGKRRGGFAEPFLSFSRAQLSECTPDAFMLMSGDCITFPTWYVQLVEGFRRDVTAIDANLLGTSWYPLYLKNHRGVAMSLNDAIIDSMEYCTWSPTSVTIPPPGAERPPLTWMVKPSYYGKYLLKGDRILLDILQQNIRGRDVYFPLSADSSMTLSLDNYLLPVGLLKKLSGDPAMEIKQAGRTLSENLFSFSIHGLDSTLISHSPDMIQVLNSYRWAYLGAARAMPAGSSAKVAVLKEQMDRQFPETRLPYVSADHRAYLESIMQ